MSAKREQGLKVHTVHQRRTQALYWTAGALARNEREARTGQTSPSDLVLSSDHVLESPRGPIKSLEVHRHDERKRSLARIEISLIGLDVRKHRHFY